MNKYEYNNYCIETCPNSTYVSNNNKYLCLDKTIEDNYYYNKNNNIYEECYYTCKKCDEGGNETNNNCIECKDGFMFLNVSLNETNCYEICPHYYYFNESNKYVCTDEEECTKNYNKLIKEKNKCIDDCSKDNIYIYEYNNICDKNYKNELIEKTNQILEEPNISTIQNLIQLNKTDIIINDESEKINYPITTSSYQKANDKKYNETSINLGDCETKLKDYYKIPENDELYILKMDIYLDGMKIPKVEYEVYYPFYNQNLSKLNLSICHDLKINITIPVDIPINEIDKYNASSGLYNDLCYTLTTENGTDESLKDRRKDFVDNNMTVSGEN